MNTDYRSRAHDQARPRRGARSRKQIALLLPAVVLAVLVALTVIGCGRHFHVIFHEGQRVRVHMTSEPGRQQEPR